MFSYILSSKLILIFLVSILSPIIFAEEDIYVLNSHYKTSQTMFNLSDGSNYNTWTMKGSWTDNFSNFGSVNCVGQAQRSKKKDLSIYGVCEIKDEKKLKFDIEVDGGINFENNKIVIQAGANILVSGTTIFKENNGNIKKNIDFLKLV